jgi:hypothetical protein
MMQAINHIIEYGPKYGYVLSLSKGSYCLGECSSYEEALKRKSILVDKGFSEDIIHIHPNNHQQGATNADIVTLQTRYGMKVLGVYMGTSQYVQDGLTSKIDKLRKEKEVITAFPDQQVKNLIYRWSYCAKINHLLRTIPPNVTATFVTDYNYLKKEILCSLLNDPDYPAHDYDVSTLPDRVWNQAQLHLNEGGLGIHDHHLTSYAAYGAAFTEASAFLSLTYSDLADLIQQVDPQQLNSEDSNMIQQYKKALHIIAELNDPEDPISIDTIIKQVAESNNRTVQHDLMRSTSKRYLQTFEDSLDADDLG